ncbi:hypothetical protein N0V83_000251 [Neocucurbitaria cava]|uniref:Centromere protein H C-terminal domain-containing protein n=1 Tax=Neocucurbitaria cava TaxID=798079 RepID=A0A9W8YHF7_9PLEO|nr:hypothetical protein N0V83_000251 [Neocucurbitaria cava]
MAAKADVEMADALDRVQDPQDYTDLLQTNHCDAFAFSESEKLALELYDQLQELELQKSLLQAQQSVTHDVSALSDDDLQEQLIIAQREAMEAKAEYEIRNSISHNVLVMDPVLKAVHGGEHTGFAENTAEQARIVADKKNRELSQTMLALAEEMKAQSAKDIEDPKLRDQVDAVDKELKESRRRMKTLKGVLSAMIVGSGINWAADEGLTELVLDDEEDG